MLATLKIEGKEFPIEISDPELQKILKEEKETGYERKIEEEYYFITSTSCAAKAKGVDHQDTIDNALYDSANYYTSKEVVGNVARAEKLMRQLRRFSAEHRDNRIVWGKEIFDSHFFIYYSRWSNQLAVDSNEHCQSFTIYFDTKKHAEEAIKEFKDELIWYFTEYKDTAEI